jgi:hypothetical protein
MSDDEPIGGTQEIEADASSLVDANLEEDENAVEEPTEDGKKKRVVKTTTTLERQKGKSLLPVARVQKILKADKARDVFYTATLTRFVDTSDRNCQW